MNTQQYKIFVVLFIGVIGIIACYMWQETAHIEKMYGVDHTDDTPKAERIADHFDYNDFFKEAHITPKIGDSYSINGNNIIIGAPAGQMSTGSLNAVYGGVITGSR